MLLSNLRMPKNIYGNTCFCLPEPSHGRKGFSEARLASYLNDVGGAVPTMAKSLCRKSSPDP